MSQPILTLGKQDVQFGGEHLQDMRSSYPDEDVQVLRQRLAEDGYICVRGLIPRDAVMAARKVLFDQMKADDALTQECTIDEPRGSGKSYMGQKHVTHHQDFLGMVENQALYNFFDRLFDEASVTFDYKWARAVPKGAAGTQAHMDVVYMGRGSQELKTCWIPIGDIPIENGPMAVLPKSHNSSATQRIRETYGAMDVDRDHIQGWFSDNYLELSELVEHPWVSSSFEAGDVVIMGMYLMHGSIQNKTDRVRFTVDTRFQERSAPIDERWVGENPIAHREWWRSQQDGTAKSIEESRAEWGV